MPTVKCPRSSCSYETEDVEAVLAAALLNAHVGEHAAPQTQGGGGNSARPPPVDRPKIQSACHKADWNIFKSRWRSFKSAANISPEKVVHQLLGCLDPDLTTLVYNEASSPEVLNEEDLLELICKVAVKPENVWVTREKLHSMTQDVNEPITSFAARLKGQARLCGFSKTVTCSAEQCNQDTTIDFTEVVVMGDVVRGLADPEVKAIVLGEVEQKTDLKELIKLIQAKEYGKSSTSAATVSVSELSPTEKRKCSYCGGVHKGGKDNCPANGKKCNNCSKLGHFAKVCRSKENLKKKTNAVEEANDDMNDESTNAIESEFG